MASQQSVRKQRGAPLVAKILDAALVEIARVGPYELSIDKVAKRADVNKTTIYRRWANPEILAFAAFEHGSSTAPMPDTGSLRADVIQYLQLMREVCRTPAMLSMARIQFGGEFSGTLGAMVKERIGCADCDALLMFERAVARAELPLDTDIKLVRDLIVGGVQHLLLFRNDPLSDETLERLVDIALAGAGYLMPVVSPDRSTKSRRDESGARTAA